MILTKSLQTQNMYCATTPRLHDAKLWPTHAYSGVASAFSTSTRRAIWPWDFGAGLEEGREEGDALRRTRWSCDAGRNTCSRRGGWNDTILRAYVRAWNALPLPRKLSVSQPSPALSLLERLVLVHFKLGGRFAVLEVQSLQLEPVWCSLQVPTSVRSSAVQMRFFLVRDLGSAALGTGYART